MPKINRNDNNYSKFANGNAKRNIKAETLVATGQWVVVK
jgi:hypothetical protein